MRRVTAAGAAALGVGLGLFSLDVARDEPGYWFAGASAAAGAALLVAGWALIGGGLTFWLRRPESSVGPLLAAAGFAWFVPELNAPGVGWAPAFTAGLALSAACPALVGHAVLAYPSGPLATRLERAAVVVAYGGALLVLGILPALLFDPQAQGCSECPRNLVRVADRASAAEQIMRAGIYLGLGWALALAALAAVRLVRAPPSGRPVLAAGAVYLVLVAAAFAVALDRGFVTDGTIEQRLWFGQAAALTALAAAVAWSWVRARRARSMVARLVVDLSRSPPPGGLRDLLADLVGDPELVLAFPLGSSARLVDSQGRSVELASGQQRTPLVRDGITVAVLGHAPGRLSDVQLVDEVAAAARLALENERLQAEVRARLEQLRTSRARIVASADAERKRLERDLHDGAQQRLVGLALSVRLAQAELSPAAGAATLERLGEAEAALRLAVEELRELAHGIFPAVLTDEGLAAAVEALAEEGRIPIRIGALPEGRFAPAVETAAYNVVAEAARTAPGGITVGAACDGAALVLEVDAPAGGPLELVQLEDRVRAIDGRLAVQPRNGRITIRAELPCDS